MNGAARFGLPDQVRRPALFRIAVMRRTHGVELSLVGEVGVVPDDRARHAPERLSGRRVPDEHPVALRELDQARVAEAGPGCVGLHPHAHRVDHRVGARGLTPRLVARRPVEGSGLAGLQPHVHEVVLVEDEVVAVRDGELPALLAGGRVEDVQRAARVLLHVDHHRLRQGPHDVDLVEGAQRVGREPLRAGTQVRTGHVGRAVRGHPECVCGITGDGRGHAASGTAEHDGLADRGQR